MTPTTGYLPTREQMRTIIGAARELFRVVRRWQKYAHLPGFPIERGNQSALRAIFELERALNPKGLAWGLQGRGDLLVRNWGPAAADGVAWLRGLLDVLMEKNRLESMAAVADFETWSAACGTIPESVSLAEDELLALRTAIRWLPRLDAPVDVGEAAPPQRPKAESPEAFPEGDPVILFGPRTSPLVLGRAKEKLTLPQFRVVKALLEAGDAGLSKARLQEISGDAVNVLKRLAKSDDAWGAVIHLPGAPGRGYRIGAPGAPDRSTPPHTAAALPSHTTPH